MTIDIAAIRARAAKNQAYVENNRFGSLACQQVPALLTDISALVEEVERLARQNSAITNAADHLLMVRNTRAEAAEQRAAAAEGLLAELHAMVWGECRSLLDEDSGGNATLDSAIRDHLEASNAEQIVQVPVVGVVNEGEG